MAFYVMSGKFAQIGGFNWNLNFHWIPVPQRVRSKLRRFTDPLPSPTMAGGIFAIDKAFFNRLGGYDPGFEVSCSKCLSDRRGLLTVYIDL